MSEPTREIKVEVSEQTADELAEVAWEYGIDQQTLATRLCEKAAERGRN